MKHAAIFLFLLAFPWLGITQDSSSGSSGAAGPIPQYAAISWTTIVDGAGNPILSGTVTFTPFATASGGTLVPTLTGGGRVVPRPIAMKIVNGVLVPVTGTAQLVDTTQANPANFCYQDSIHDNASGKTWTADNCLQPAWHAYWCTYSTNGTTSTTSCDLNKYVAAGTAGSLVTAGPTGVNWRGAWSSSISYQLRDAVSYQGSSYINTVAGNTTTPPGTGWSLLSQVGSTGATGATGAIGAPGNATFTTLFTGQYLRGTTATTAVGVPPATVLNDLVPGATSTGSGTSNVLALPGVLSVAGPVSQTIVNPPATSHDSGVFPAYDVTLKYSGPSPIPCSPILGTTWCSDRRHLGTAKIIWTSTGFNRGNPATGGGGWSERGFEDLTGTNYGRGQMLNKRTMTQAGVGDFSLGYWYGWDYGEGLAASDEGLHLFAANGGEMGTANRATVTAAAIADTTLDVTGAVALQVNCPSGSDCNFGSGRTLLDLSRPAASGYASAYAAASGETPEQYTVVVNSGTVTPSVAWGTLVSAVTPPMGTSKSSEGTTAETVSVLITGGSGSSVGTGVLGCFAGQFHEQAYPASVNWNSGTSTLTATFNLRQPHEAGSYVYFGGMCGNFLVFTANISDGLKFPVDVLGAPDATHLVTRPFALAYVPGNVTSKTGNILMLQQAVTNLSRTGTTVSMTAYIPSYHVGKFNGAASLYLSGDATGKFNGICTGAAFVVSSNTLTCTKSGTDGDTSSAATVAIGDNAYGNADFTIYPGAEVLSSENLIQTWPTGNLILEPNATAWTAGDSVEEEHLASEAYRFIQYNVTVHNPGQVSGSRNMWRGISLDLGGAGIVGIGGNNFSSFSGSALQITNQNASSLYQYQGGQQVAPNLLKAFGRFGSGISMQYAPDYMDYGFYIGAPASGVSDANYSYVAMGLKGASAVDGLSYAPSTDTITVNGGSCHISAATGTLTATGCGFTSGLLKASSGTLSAAVAGTDYAVPSGSITGNAATATALAATPTTCSTGYAPTGVLANGNATGCAALTAGSVTSVGLSVSGPLYAVSGSPVTSSGTLTLTPNTQTANTVFAGPSSGAAAAPTFRALVSADVPTTTINGTTCTPGSSCTVAFSASAVAFTALTDGATVTWATGGAGSSNTTLTLAHTTASRTLDVTGLASGASLQIVLKQDSTGGATLTLGTGCTWYLGTNAGFVASTSPSLVSTANGINILSAIYDGTNCYANVR